MIESIRGTVVDTGDSTINLRTGPVVLMILTPGYFLRRIEVGQTLDVPVYLHFQMEGNRMVPIIVGFPEIRDREFFEQFISVSGVGVKAAVKALARPPEEIASAIASEDYAYLTALPGIGNKRAKQIVARLQDQMVKVYGSLSAVSPGSAALNEARAVLRQLGIPSSEAETLLARTLKELGDDADTPEMVKCAMRIRSRK
ncbi:MAG: hypothetical protein KAQ97_09370 [Candidatus Fermentibacteraceae bacterium]|nr:hypothetical protein [Candidatus Fermentibacteraceae bacterium]